MNDALKQYPRCSSMSRELGEQTSLAIAPVGDPDSSVSFVAASKHYASIAVAPSRAVAPATPIPIPVAPIIAAISRPVISRVVKGAAVVSIRTGLAHAAGESETAGYDECGGSER